MKIRTEQIEQAQAALARIKELLNDEDSASEWYTYKGVLVDISIVADALANAEAIQ